MRFVWLKNRSRMVSDQEKQTKLAESLIRLVEEEEQDGE
jgi:hypothetical protein